MYEYLLFPIFLSFACYKTLKIIKENYKHICMHILSSKIDPIALLSLNERSIKSIDHLKRSQKMNFSYYSLFINLYPEYEDYGGPVPIKLIVSIRGARHR